MKSLIATVMQTNGMLGLIDKHRNNEEITLKAIQDEWSEKYLIQIREDNHYFLNQYQYITSLLAFIVIPKEIIFENLPNLNIANLPDTWGLTNIGDYDLKLFIRRMRNSISHGRIIVNNQMNFTFNDVNPNNNNDYFECTFSEHNLRKFVHSFAYWIMTGLFE